MVNCDSIMHNLSVYAAKREIEGWIGHYIPLLASEARSSDAEEMTMNLARLIYNVKVQLSAIDEQWSQDAWSERLEIEEQMAEER
jgi:hypothetical protein